MIWPNAKRVVGVILVYDITDPDSFYNLKFWFEFAQALIGREAIYMLMPNKVDEVITSP